jgi:hypothetical protein
MRLSARSSESPLAATYVDITRFGSGTKTLKRVGSIAQEENSS